MVYIISEKQNTAVVRVTMTVAKSMFMECYSAGLSSKQSNQEVQMGTPMHIHSIYQSGDVHSCCSKSVFIKTEGRL